MFHRLALLLFALLGIALLLAMIQYFPPPERTNYWDSVFDTGHIFVFGTITCLFLLIAYVVLGTRWVATQYLTSIIAALVLGIAVEIWQKYHDRSPELVDVINDGIGIAAFAMLFAILDTRLREPRRGMTRRSFLFMAAIVLVLVGFVPFFRVASLYRARSNAMPTLIRFDQPWEQKFFYVQSGDFSVTTPPDDWPASHAASHLGRMELRAGRFSGIVMHEPYPDWTGYKFLELDILYQSDSPRTYTLRVHDTFHNNDPLDRFRQEILLQPGFQSIRIPLARIENASMLRSLQLKFVSGMTFYTVGIVDPEVVYLGNVRLTK